MTAMELAFRNASKNNAALADIVGNAAKNIAAEKAKAEAEAAAKRKAEEEKVAAEAAKQRREELKDQIEAQNTLVLFGFSFSPMDYSMACGVVWAESLEDAKRKLGIRPKLRITELNRSSDVIVIDSYFE